jgi:hypothetical protein
VGFVEFVANPTGSPARDYYWNPAVLRTTNFSSRLGKNLLANRDTHTSSSQQPILEGSRMEGIRKSLLSKEISSAASNLIQDSWRTATNSRYNSHWRMWSAWCANHHIHSTDPTIFNVVNFLADQFMNGKKYGVIAGYRSAISTTLTMFGKPNWGDHPLISRLMKGIDNRRPSGPKYSKFWDVGILLKEIDSWERSEILDAKRLTLKIIALLRLALIGRSSDIEKIIFSQLVIDAEKATFQFFQKKQQKNSRQASGSIIPRYSQNLNICPVHTLEVYIHRTSGWRSSLPVDDKNDRLILAMVEPHLPLSSDRLANSILKLMNTVGVDTSVYTAGSLRGGTASKLLDSGRSVEEVMRQGQWKSFSVFETFYNRSAKTVNVIQNLSSN